MEASGDGAEDEAAMSHRQCLAIVHDIWSLSESLIVGKFFYESFKARDQIESSRIWWPTSPTSCSFWRGGASFKENLRFCASRDH